MNNEPPNDRNRGNRVRGPSWGAAGECSQTPPEPIQTAYWLLGASQGFSRPTPAMLGRGREGHKRPRASGRQSPHLSQSRHECSDIGYWLGAHLGDGASATLAHHFVGPSAADGFGLEASAALADLGRSDAEELLLWLDQFRRNPEIARIATPSASMAVPPVAHSDGVDAGCSTRPAIQAIR